MDMPPAGTADHSGPNLYKPPDDRLYGSTDALPLERPMTDDAEHAMCKTSGEKPCLIGLKAGQPKRSLEVYRTLMHSKAPVLSHFLRLIS